MTAKERTNKIFDYVINQMEAGKLKPIVCAKSICVDAHFVSEDEVGSEHIVWSNGKVEKTITLNEDMVLLTTLDKNGNPITDEFGHKNIYDMKVQKFNKTYTTQINGHYMKDPTAPGSVMMAVKLDDNMIGDEGLTMCPPNWGGYEGTLVKGGILMFPFDKDKDLKEHVEYFKKQGCDNIDWYPNNETQTYSVCDKNGTFKDQSLRQTFNQKESYKGDPLSDKDNTLSK